MEAEWGSIIQPEQVESALKGSGAKLVGIVYAETSTGIRQPLEEILKITHENGALLLADTVTSLGGLEVKIDEWGVDAAYSGTQKCLSCPPGLSPVNKIKKIFNFVLFNFNVCIMGLNPSALAETFRSTN